VLKVLTERGKDRIWACDTEVADINVKKQGPVGNGAVTCISMYGGPDIDFGEGVNRNVLWIDNIDKNQDLIKIFASWFSDETYKKVWHNYGFDRHVMCNEGIDCRGFGGDTMHMARWGMCY
jgi:DNA polymerase-1